MKRLFIYKGLELEANINGYATYELKIDKFRHEYASQLNMYLNYFKAEVMQPDDNPPIGILLCTEKGDTLVKYGGLSTQRHTHLAVGGFRVLAPKPYLHVSMYTAFH